MREASAAAPRTVWLRLSILAGNIIQLAGLAGGFAAIGMAAGARSPTVAIMDVLTGWLLLYFSCHAIAHWIVGRLLHIRFRCYTLGGTAKPETWPPGLRWVFQHLPFLGVQTERASMQSASPNGRAAMWAAGATSSVLVPTLAALWAWRLHVPLGGSLFLFSALWSVGTVLSNFRPGGDYFKSIRALEGQ
jgi:hypothetical protein